jgi:DnaJ-class molecular chaperone
MHLKWSSSFSLLGLFRVDSRLILRGLSSPGHSLYTVLGLRPQADPKEVKESFYRLSKEHHPDLSKDGGAANIQRFREIAEAYAILGNPESRRKYDEEHNLLER